MGLRLWAEGSPLIEFMSARTRNAKNWPTMNILLSFSYISKRAWPPQLAKITQNSELFLVFFVNSAQYGGQALLKLSDKLKKYANSWPAKH